MRITIETTAKENLTVPRRIASIETESDNIGIDEVISEFINVLTAYGFHYKSVENGIIDKAEEIQVAQNQQSPSYYNF